MSRPTATKPDTSQGPAPAAVIHADELYTKEELCRRMRWRQHSWRQAKRLGLETVVFGSRTYIAGSDAIAFLQSLKQQEKG